jgi:hypothetical protein
VSNTSERRPNLRLSPPPVDSKHHWRRLLNHLYGCGEDVLLIWLRDVRRAVEEAERRRAA